MKRRGKFDVLYMYEVVKGKFTFSTDKSDTTLRTEHADPNKLLKEKDEEVRFVKSDTTPSAEPADSIKLMKEKDEEVSFDKYDTTTLCRPYESK